MTKLAHFLTSLFFVIVCSGLWFIWRTTSILIATRLGGSAMLEPMMIVLGYYNWICVLPVPAVIYSAFLMDRHELLVEKVVVYALLVACISSVLVLGSIGLIGWQMSIPPTAGVGAN